MKYKKIIVTLYLEPQGKVEIQIPKESPDIDKIGEEIEKLCIPKK